MAVAFGDLLRSTLLLRFLNASSTSSLHHRSFLVIIVFLLGAPSSSSPFSDAVSDSSDDMYGAFTTNANLFLSVSEVVMLDLKAFKRCAAFCKIHILNVIINNITV